MAFSRAAAFRSFFRGARPTTARPQLLRQVARRGYASGGHEAPKAGGDAVWAAGAVAVTVPACWYLLANGPDTSHGHGDHGDDHGKSHGEEEEGGEEESEDEPEEKAEESSEEKEDSDKSEDSDSEDDKKEADTPDTSDDEGDDKEATKKDGNTTKSVPDAKGGSKKRVESEKGVKQGEGETEGGDDEPKDKAAASKSVGGKGSQSSKQEGLTNTDTKHSTDINNDPSKSKKGEGAPETAKVKGTVDPKRPQLQLLRSLFKRITLAEPVSYPHPSFIYTKAIGTALEDPPVLFAMLPQHIPCKKNLPAAPPEYPATTGEPERLGFYHHYHVPTEVPPNTSVAIVHENGGVGSVRLCRNPNPHTHSKETFPGWMTRMWKKPPAGDVGSCCVAFWFPALLFGKTDWRLKQASRGGNPQNTSWKAKDGCNGCCWAYFGLQSLVGLDFILIALQRSRIRQVYGIEGSKAADWANAIFCRPCTVLQNDREVRAREGKHDLLSNTEKYKEHQKTLGEMVNTQPCPIQPMSYLSQRSNLDRDRRPGTENIAMEPQKPQAAHNKTGPNDGSEDQAPEAQPVRVKSKAPKIVHRSLTHSGDQPTAKVTPARLAHRGSLSGPISPRHEDASSREHALFECSGDGTSSPRWMSKKKKKAGASEISYVHDFTDCAVDKSILDYYERQGRVTEMKQQAGNLVSPSVGARSSSKRPS